MKFNHIHKTLLAILFLLVTYWPVSSGLFTMKYDMMDWFYPMRHLVGECLQNNLLPIWNPYTNLGYPLHVDPQSGALYPLVWLLGWLFGYSIFTINLEYVLHIIIGFYGMKKLAETLGIEGNIALVIGLSYACCGFFVANAQHLSWIIAAAWIPYVFCYHLRLLRALDWRDALWLSIFSGLLLTGAYPAFTIVAFYIMGIAFAIRLGWYILRKKYPLLKRLLWQHSLFGLAFLAQGLVFLKFFLESLPLLVRTETLSLANIQLLPFSPAAFTSFLLPFMTGGHASFFNTDISMSNGYFGLIAFVFLLTGLSQKRSRKSILLWGLGLFFLLVSMGEYFYLRAWLYHYVPMMNLFRYPSLFRIFTLLFFLLLAGLAFQKYKQSKPSKRQWQVLRIISFALLLAISSVFIYALQKSAWRFPESLSAESIVAFFNNSTNSEMVLIQAPIQIILLSLLLFKSYFKKGISFINFAFLLIFVDLFLAVQLNHFLTITSEVKMAQLQEKMDAYPKGFPIPTDKVSTVSHHGNKSTYPIWYNLNILQKKVANNGYNNFKFRAYRTFKDQAGYEKVLDHQLLYRPGNPIVDSTIMSLRDQITIKAFAPNKIEASVEYKTAGELVLLQYFYPGWEVKLDGKTVPAFQKEGIFIGLSIPAGTHQVRFEFYPKYFTLLLIFSFGVFIGLFLYLLLFAKPSRPIYHKS